MNITRKMLKKSLEIQFKIFPALTKVRDFFKNEIIKQLETTFDYM